MKSKMDDESTLKPTTVERVVLRDDLILRMILARALEDSNACIRVCKTWHDMIKKDPHLRLTRLRHPRSHIGSWLKCIDDGRSHSESSNDVSKFVQDILFHPITIKSVDRIHDRHNKHASASGWASLRDSVRDSSSHKDAVVMSLGTKMSLLCEAAAFDAFHAFKALYQECEDHLRSDMTPKYIIKMIFCQAAWAFGDHGARVFRFLWNKPVRQRLGPIDLIYESRVPSIMDVLDPALSSLEMNATKPENERLRPHIGRNSWLLDLKWLIKSISWISGFVCVWEHMWLMAPTVTRIAVENFKDLGFLHIHVVSGIGSESDLAFLDEHFGTQIVDSGLRVHSDRMYNRFASRAVYNHVIMERLKNATNTTSLTTRALMPPSQA